VKVRLYNNAASANCFKARLLLALLGREYGRVPVDIGDTLTDAFASLQSGARDARAQAGRWHGADPVERDRLVPWRGTAFVPESALGRAQVAQWLSFEQERVMSGIGSARFRIRTGRDLGLVPARLGLAESALSMLEAHLAGRS
jgi:glutathione S-transferase